MPICSVQIAVLGPLVLRVGDVEIPLRSMRHRKILVVLALRPGEVVSDRHLVDALWGDRPPKTATAQVQNCCGTLRQILNSQKEPETLLRKPSGYVLDVPALAVDAHRFEATLRESKNLIRQGDSNTAMPRLRDALSLWRGSALEDTADGVLLSQASRLEELRREAIETYATAQLESGLAAEAAADLYVWAAQHPYDEAIHSQLMLALHSTGRTSEAIDVCRSFQARLRRELGIQAGGTIESALARILAPAAPAIPGTSVTTQDHMARLLELMSDVECKLVEAKALIHGIVPR